MQKIILLIAWITFIILTYAWMRSVGALPVYDIPLTAYPSFLQEQVATLGAIAPLVYILGYTVRPIILFPATVFTALAGLLFGPYWGFLFAFIGENFSASLAYWIGRYLGPDALGGESASSGRVQKTIEYLRDRGFVTVLMMRLLYFPFDFTNYICGIAKISWGQYALATALGIIPGLTVFLLIGSAIGTENTNTTFYMLGLSAAIFVLSLILSRSLQRRHQGLTELKEEA